MISSALLVLAAYGAAPAFQAAADPSSAGAWQVGPIVRGRNYSAGMPPHPTPARRGWYVDFPDRGELHALTFDHGPLTGKRRIVLRYRVDAAPGVRFVPQESPGDTATISLFFQRRGDNWSARGPYAWYRWYAPGATVAPITPGEHQMVVNLDASWTSVMGQPVAANPAAFDAAIEEAGTLGIVFGTTSARCHGVYSPGPARLTVLSFQVI
jgi:hypothetical protein